MYKTSPHRQPPRPRCRAQVREETHTRQPPAPCIGFRYTVLDKIHIDIAKQRAQAHMDRLCRPDPRQQNNPAARMTTIRRLWHYG